MVLNQFREFSHKLQYFSHFCKRNQVNRTTKTYKRITIEIFFSFFCSYPPPYKHSEIFSRGPIDLIPFAKVGKSIEVYGKIHETDLKPLIEP